MKQNESPEILKRAAASKVMEPEAYKKALLKQKKPHDLRVKYEGKMFLPADYATQIPFIDPTPRHWRKISIQSESNLFCLLTFGSRTRIPPGDLRLAGLPADLQLDDLSLAEALRIGGEIERAYCEKFPSRSK